MAKLPQPLRVAKAVLHAQNSIDMQKMEQLDEILRPRPRGTRETTLACNAKKELAAELEPPLQVYAPRHTAVKGIADADDPVTLYFKEWVELYVAQPASVTAHTYKLKVGHVRVDFAAEARALQEIEIEASASCVTWAAQCRERIVDAIESGEAARVALGMFDSAPDRGASSLRIVGLARLVVSVFAHFGLPRPPPPAFTLRLSREFGNASTGELDAAACAFLVDALFRTLLRAHLEEVHQQAKQAKQAGKVHQAKKNGGAEDIEAAAIDFRELVFGAKLGAGGFGAVFRGTFRGHTVAIKQCNLGSLETASQVLQEVRYLYNLRHPRLVSFYGFCSDAQNLVIVMELMVGGSLFSAIFGPCAKVLSFRQQARMVAHVAEGLTYLHSQNVVHRDLKSQNIVLDEKQTCKICDFGLSLTVESTHLSVLGQTGTPNFMAPEQFQPRVRITDKVDIWAMGCVFLELFCKSVPYKYCCYNDSGAPVSNPSVEIARQMDLRRSPQIPNDTDPLVQMIVRSCHRFESQERPAAPALEVAIALLLSSYEDAME